MTRNIPRRKSVGGRPRRCRINGFTLVELLVVVSILALLIAILLPSLRRAREQGKKVKCMANLHAIHVALVCYADDNRQELPSYTTMGEWGFRVRPGTILKYKPSDGGYPEYHGVQAVLHNGYGPPPLEPNGLPDYSKLLGKPVYLPADSDVWLCPSNIGPKGHEQEWKKFGNTYFYYTNKAGVDDDPDADGADDAEEDNNCLEEDDTGKTYNLDWLNRGQKKTCRKDGTVRWEVNDPKVLVKDNYFQKPAPSGMGRPDKPSDYNYEYSSWRPPHYLSAFGNKSTYNGNVVAALSDGRVEWQLYNH